MNSDLMRWLLDVDVIPRDAETLRLAWERPWPAWAWALLVLAAALLAGWSYARLSGRRSLRGVLAGVRLLVVLLVLIVISGPMLELPRESVELDWVMLLADRSASMNIADATAPSRVNRVSRDEQLQSVVTDNEATFRGLADQREVRWLGFHSGTFGLEAADGPSPIALGPAEGARTNLNRAVEEALQRAAARPVSGLVVFSDGRTNDPPTRSLLRRLQAEAIPVFVVPLGSAEPMGDLAIRRAEGPRRAFVRDKVPVVVELDRFGSAVARMGAVVKLVDDSSGQTLDEVELPPGDLREELTLIAEPEMTGETSWSVVVETGEPDLVPTNNTKSLLIDLVDRPLRVLYVEGYPRWEYRYLKNLLVREESIESSVMLLSADRDFAQEGNQPISRLPRSPEEFAQFDVVVLGDAPGSFFSPDQLEMIRAHVAERGAGLLWIGGERATPLTYAGTVLADLLPMRGSLKLLPVDGPVNMVPTALAERRGVLRVTLDDEALGWPEELRDPSYGWSQLYYAQSIEPARLKPTAEVLAQTASPVDGIERPLVTMIRYGAGQSIYVATDEIWRWRYGRGERLPDQFWIQMIRMLGRESLITAEDRALLRVSPRRLAVNQPLRVVLQIVDARLLEARRAGVEAVLETADGDPIAQLELRRLADAEDEFAATYLPEVTGDLRVRVSDPSLQEVSLSVPVEVFAPDDEMRRPETDHATLQELADLTGGAVLAPEQVSELPELLPNRSVRTLNPLRERIWDTPLIFALLVLLLTTEWVGRKILRLI
jgi:hypothetical protein